MLDVRRLQALQAVARHGSIAAAAQALHFTAPAISQQLAALERDTEASLFIRTGRSIRLTSAGMLLAAHADIVLTQLEAASAALAASRAPSGPLTVAAFPTAVATIVPAALAELRQRYPGIEATIIEAEPEKAEQLLRAGSVDAAIVHHYNLVPRLIPGIVESEPLFDEPMLIVLPHQPAPTDGSDHVPARSGRIVPPHPPGEPHPPALRDPGNCVDVATMRNERWIVPTIGTTCHELVQRACGAAGFVPIITAHCNDYRSTLALVRAGCGIALVPSLALDNLSLDGLTVQRTSVPLRRYISVQTHAGHLSSAVSSFIESLHTVIPAPGFADEQPTLSNATSDSCPSGDRSELSR